MNPPNIPPPSTLSPEQLDARALARSRRAAMHRRARRIRRSIVSLTAALFSAAFLAIYVQLASGHDPALSKARTTTSATLASTPTTKTTATRSATTSTSSPSASTESSASSGAATKEASSSSSANESSKSASAVTTSHS